MSTRTAPGPTFVGSIPYDYDRFLGPFLFEPYAVDLARRIGRVEGGRILEFACGTGILTRRLCAGAGAAELVATDIAQPMLDAARELRGDLPNVRYRRVDAALLPFDDASFDLVCAQFGLMFVEDKLQCLREVRRVLRPGGRFVFNVWDDFASNPYVRVVQDALATFFESDPPEFLERPWGFSDLDPLRYLVHAAGFGEFEIDVVRHVSRDCTPKSIASGLVLGTPTVGELEARCPVPVDVVVEEVGKQLAARFGDEDCAVPKQAIVVSARA